MVQVLIRKQNAVFNEDGTCSQDEREEQIDVDVIPGAVKLPAEQRKDFPRDFLLKKKVSLCKSSFFKL